MSDSTAALPAQQTSPEDGAHFLRAVTDMAARRHVVTGEAIYTDKGVKLVDKGSHIDSRMYERLVEHKLRDPIDKYLSVEGCVDLPGIATRAAAQCEATELMRRLAQALGGAERLLAPVRKIMLPPQMGFKLTVMREQRPELFEHSLQMMLVAIYLAQKEGWDEHDRGLLATAALVHDVGMLYVDPAWIDSEHWLNGAERRHLIAHSVTGMLIVRSVGCYPQAVEMAVLDHHERMDGSGYPRGSRGDAISKMGQVLLLAEVVSAFFDKFQDLPGQRLSLMLRMNHRCYPAHLVRHILPLLYDEMAPGTPLPPLQAEVTQNLTALSAAFQMWTELSRQFPENWQAMPDHQAAIFIEAGLARMQHRLAGAGLHPHQQTELLASLPEDVQGMGELALVGREALWQLQAIVNACLRRWPGTQARMHAVDAAVMDWCEACVKLDAEPAEKAVAGTE
ncbi:HD-GYP domain-containing protein [Comamonas guangdongensis]|uniref:HD-GYP domain-containing protein n=1 Tax=Comamonas guangdongensis TaxID=510515 RepID=A0ABV4A0Y6_9BURK